MGTDVPLYGDVVILGPDDPLPGRPTRIVVAGTSGSGKTTLSGRLAAVLGTEHTEIDALYHGPSWIPRESFESDVDAFSSRESWVTEWQYGLVRDRLADRADLMVWLDLPRSTVMRQVIARTVRRRLRREVLWNGNIEAPLHRIFVERDHIVRWAWTTHRTTQRKVRAVAERRPDLPVVRLRSHDEADRWTSGPLADAASQGFPC